MDIIASVILWMSAVVCILGVAANIFGAVILKKMEKVKIGGVRLLRYLAYADVSVLFCYIATKILELFNDCSFATNGIQYVAFAFLHLKRMTMTFEIYLTVLISVQRSLALALPFKMATYMTERRVNKILIGIGVLSVALPVPACVMLVPRLSQKPVSNVTMVSTEPPEQQNPEWVYHHYILGTFYIYIPLVVLVASNVILVVLRCRMDTKVRNTNTRGPGQLTAVVLTMTATSVATHVSNLFYINICSGVDHISDQTECVPKLITNLFLYINCSANFVFYCCFGRAFRGHLAHALCKRAVPVDKTDTTGDSHSKV